MTPSQEEELQWLRSENQRLRDYIECADKRLARQWQPIATAPKDGTRIFALWLYNGKTQLAVETYWHSDESEGDKPFWYSPGLAWMLDGIAPSHWQPLPSAPVTR